MLITEAVLRADGPWWRRGVEIMTKARVLMRVCQNTFSLTNKKFRFYIFRLCCYMEILYLYRN